MSIVLNRIMKTYAIKHFLSLTLSENKLACLPSIRLI
jgi:hypothetical protein